MHACKVGQGPSLTGHDHTMRLLGYWDRHLIVLAGRLLPHDRALNQTRRVRYGVEDLRATLAPEIVIQPKR